MVTKRTKADDVGRIVQPIVEALEALGQRFDEIGRRMDAGFAAIGVRLERVEQNTADTADGVRRLERSAVGIGRAVALEDRVSRIEKRLGIEPAG